MNQEFLYIIIIITLGYLLKRLHILQEKDGEVISKIIFKITLPALVLVTFDSVKIETSLILLPVIVLVYGIITAFLGFLVFKNVERELKGSFLMLSSGFNVGLFAFPLVYAIWGMDGLTYFSMFDVGTSFVVFGIAFILGSYFSEEGLSLKPIEILKKLGKSIPLMTYLIASILNFSHIQLPDTIIHVAKTISGANMPLSLLLLGIYLNFKFEKQFIKPMVKFLTFRYGLGLLFGFALYLFLPYNQMFRFTILIGMLLPVAASALTFAVEFKYSTSSTRLIATISNITILISIVILYIFANFIL
ncbi:auxin efflux carrier (AEC) family transporter [Neobacillus bataviensis LMG 21833]|uniref:Auxin efflux carrier (AEC) family transporter n=1 Tax=Neobacillus bataviensis LMG 21833 TaxID=1117379 RepID=K6DSS9_9BACI|nr:AEC family transporter [Neobacillus bataviensis]EKN71303.1 auxin efflux carrier (AEC) family transporter [Neobacillus bataviensis LMG 21833]